MDSRSSDAFTAYEDKFKVRPDFVTIRLTPDNNSHFIKACEDAIKRGAPLTEDEWQGVMTATYGDTFDAIPGQVPNLT